MQSTRDFYYEVESFSRFEKFTDGSHFKAVPEDWFIIITDVKGSTKAIEEGRYKEVNTIGAATIVTITNVLGDFEFPFVFGGDGATVLIPPQYFNIVSQALIGLKEISKQNFGLDLRIGAVEVSKVIEQGSVVEVAKYELTHGKTIALFQGGGLTVAEDLIKGEEEKYAIKGEAREADLYGLTCHWQPIPSKRGKILSILVMSKSNEKIYKEIMDFFNKTCAGNIEQANPMNIQQMSYRGSLELIKEAPLFHKSIFSKDFFQRFQELLIAFVIFTMKVKLKSFSREKYMESMTTHSDYKKFDDMLRMVLDCSDKEVSKIDEYLSRLHKEEKIFYGVHLSDTALMTCFVQRMQDGKHIHFIDGNNGGYAMAAKQLKSQIKSNA